MPQKVFVSGCYDLLHSGHIAFFKEASQYGDLYVGIGSDDTILALKGRRPFNTQQERLYMVRSIRYVKDAWINKGSGILDFEEDIKTFQPDVFVVNEDGDSLEKSILCSRLGIQYVVLKRTPDQGLPVRSSTSLKQTEPVGLPSRLDLAGTWIDQPYVSRFAPGWALTVSLEQVPEPFKERSGMSTSTIKAAKKLWPFRLPEGNPELVAKMLFCFENEPGKEEISGAQDAIGICMPGLNRHFYDKEYWPKKIESCNDDLILDWLEQHICLVHTNPRVPDFNVLEGADIIKPKVEALAAAADACWHAILDRNLEKFAQYIKASFEAQVAMFPKMMDNGVPGYIEKFKDRAFAWKLAGAGGGGYMALITDHPIEGTQTIKIRRKNWL